MTLTTRIESNEEVEPKMYCGLEYIAGTKGMCRYEVIISLVYKTSLKNDQGLHGVVNGSGRDRCMHSIKV